MKIKIPPNIPYIENGLDQLIRMGDSTRLIWAIDTTGRWYLRDNILDLHGNIDANRGPRTVGNDTDIKRVTMKSALLYI